MRKAISLDKYLKEAVRLGAAGARAILARSVVTAAWVRMKCQFGCGGFGQGLMCPPHSPAPDQTAAVLRCYKRAILIHGTGDHEDVADVAVKIERMVFLDGFYKAFSMGAGPCRLCRECNPKGGECRHPHEARPSMEACGIDVFQTARNNRFPIQVVRDHSCAQDYFGLVLVE